MHNQSSFGFRYLKFFMSSLPERLAATIKLRGKPVYQVAVESGVSPRTVFSVLGGRGSRPRNVTLAKIARALNVEREWLETGEGAASPAGGDVFQVREDCVGYGGPAVTLREAIGTIAKQLGVAEGAVAGKVAELLAEEKLREGAGGEDEKGR
jgi:lambda repressor-like predicted transcriptional regulator